MAAVLITLKTELKNNKAIFDAIMANEDFMNENMRFPLKHDVV